MNNQYMEEALKEAYEGINIGHGGPFGAVIVKEDKIIGRGHNCVLKEKDPTLHGEIMAIKDACHNLNSINLTGTSIYTTAEPCPMCLGAILWAGISRIYYGCNRKDTENIGFRDNVFYEMMEKNAMEITETDRQQCLELFEEYRRIKNKEMY